MKGPVDSAQHGGTPTVEEDLVTNPYCRLEEALEKKQRNLEKRKIRLQQYAEDERNGKKLTGEQQEAKSRLGEVDSQLEYVRDLMKTMGTQHKDYTRCNKQREEANRKKNLEQERQRLAEFVYYQSVFKILDQKHVADGVVKQGVVTEDEIELLYKMKKGFNPEMRLVSKTGMWLSDLKETTKLASAILVGTREKVVDTLNGVKAKELLERAANAESVQDMKYVMLLNYYEEISDHSELEVPLSELSGALSRRSIISTQSSAQREQQQQSQSESSEEVTTEPEVDPENEVEVEPESEPIKKDPKVVFVQNETGQEVSNSALESNTEFGYENYAVHDGADSEQQAAESPANIKQQEDVTSSAEAEDEARGEVARDPPPPIPLPHDSSAATQPQPVVAQQQQQPKQHNGSAETPAQYTTPAHAYSQEQTVWAQCQESDTKAETADAPKNVVIAVQENGGGEHQGRGGQRGMRRGRGRGGPPRHYRNNAPLPPRGGEDETAAYPVTRSPRGISGGVGTRGGRDLGGGRPGGRRSPRGYRGRGGGRNTGAGVGYDSTGSHAANTNGYGGYGGVANGPGYNHYSYYDYASSHPPRQAGFNFANDRRK